MEKLAGAATSTQQSEQKDIIQGGKSGLAPGKGEGAYEKGGIGLNRPLLFKGRYNQTSTTYLISTRMLRVTAHDCGSMSAL